jgi:hypothetical protein
VRERGHGVSIFRWLPQCPYAELSKQIPRV